MSQRPQPPTLGLRCYTTTTMELRTSSTRSHNIFHPRISLPETCFLTNQVGNSLDSYPQKPQGHRGGRLGGLLRSLVSPMTPPTKPSELENARLGMSPGPAPLPLTTRGVKRPTAGAGHTAPQVPGCLLSPQVGGGGGRTGPVRPGNPPVRAQFEVE